MPDASVSLGLDSRQIRTDLVSVDKVFQQNTNRMAHSAENAEKAAGELFKSHNRVEHGLVGLSSQLATATTATEGFAAAGETLTRVLRLPLGVGVAIGAVVAVYEKGREAIKKMGEANKELRTELSRPVGAQSNSSVDEQAGDIVKLQAAIEKSRQARKSLFSVFAPGKSLTAYEQESNARNRIEQLRASSVNRSAEELRIQDVGLHRSEEEAEILKSQLETKEKIAKIGQTKGLGEEARNSLIEDQKKVGAIAEEAIRRKYQKQGLKNLDADRGVGATIGQANIRKGGDDVENGLAQSKADEAAGELQTAQLRLQDAKGKATAEETEELERGVKAAEAKLAVADTELEQTKRTTAEKKAQQALELQNANIVKQRGREEEAALAALRNEEKVLRNRLTSAKPDEARQINVDLAKNASAQRDVNRAIQDSRSSRALAVREAAAGVQIVEAELSNHETIAEKLRTQLSFEEKIAAAKKDGNAALVRQLQLQQQAESRRFSRGYQNNLSEASKLGLEDIAYNSHTGTRNIESAREVLRLQMSARQASLDGHPDRAVNLLSKADLIRNSIPNLKNSEKQQDLKAALDESSVLKSIEKNTAGGWVNK